MSLARRDVHLMQINRSIPRGSYASIGDYVALTKPRVMSLVVFTALVGLMVAPGGIDPFTGVVALLCIAAGAGAAAALNMWYDADIDAVMARTAMRPIPGGRVSRSEALVFGLMLGICAVLTLGTLLNMAAAALLAFTIFFYVAVYTMWLKRRTPHNIVIGGAAGALPPVIGWVAVTGNVGLEPLILFLVIFLWTPPHFWALSLNLAGEYARRSRIWRGRGDAWSDLYFSRMASTSERRQGKAGCSSSVRVFDALSGPPFWCAANECCAIRSVPLVNSPERIGLPKRNQYQLAGKADHRSFIWCEAGVRPRAGVRGLRVNRLLRPTQNPRRRPASGNSTGRPVGVPSRLRARVKLRSGDRIHSA
jgi:hypothetical protein